MNKTLMVTVAMAGLFAGAAETVRLDSLPLAEMTAGWGGPRAGRSVDGKPLSLRGRRYERGVGTHALSSFKVHADGKALAFDAVVGAGLLLRSSIGVFGIAAIAVFLLLPALKILVMAVVFKISAALLEPFGEGRYVGALTDFGDVMLLLFAVVIVTGLLFFFLIFSVIGVSAMTMMFR